LGRHSDPDDAALEGDELLLHLVAEALAGDPEIRGRHLDVTVQHGVVILEGVVSSLIAKSAAGRRAWTVAGIRDVCNCLVIPGAGA
jgi:osmotically-inducible protein OsmY